MHAPRLRPPHVVVTVATLLAIVGFSSLALAQQNVEDLEASIREKQQRAEQLKQQAAAYETNLEAKRRERLTLANQITILSDRIAKTELDIEVANLTIEATNLQIRELEGRIREQEQRVVEYRQQLAAAVRRLSRSLDRSVLHVFFTHPSFAEFYDELRDQRAIQVGIRQLVVDVEALKATLAVAKEELEGKRQALALELNDLATQQLSLEAQQETKAFLLEETRSSEQRFASLLEEARREQEQTNQEIVTLEQAVRERLRAEGVETNGERPALIWPVPNSRGLSAIFHDPDYPFRRVFEHSGIDIRAYQGTPIRTAAAGYVARVRLGGARGYSFVMVIHSGGLATVYGHVSRVVTTVDSYVAQGEVIAYSGGLPGTPGAGPFSTGPHLHFETRHNGIPVDPLPFLP